MTEMELRKLYVDTARGYLGVAEGSARHHEIVDIYNSHKPLARGYALKYSDDWCAGFVSAMAVKAGLTKIIPTEVGCGQMIGLFQEMGCWVEDDNYAPQPGDVIFYDWEDSGSGDNQGGANHVGIVEKASNDVIYVFEGNMSGSPDFVGSRAIAVGGKFIRGFGVPDYGAMAEKERARYRTIEEIPYYAVATIQRLLNEDILMGKGGTEGLDLSEDMVRILVILDRAELFGSCGAKNL